MRWRAFAGPHMRFLAGRPGERAVRPERKMIDPAAFWIARDHLRDAIEPGGYDLAVVAGGEHARAVASACQNGAGVNRKPRRLRVRSDEQQRLVAENEDGGGAQKMRSHHGSAGGDRPGMLLDRGDFGRGHFAAHSSKPWRIMSSGSLRPMNTIRLSRFSSSRQFR